MTQKSTKELKRDLYRDLSSKDVADLTDTEIDIMYYLSQDEEIQEILNPEKGDNDASAH